MGSNSYQECKLCKSDIKKGANICKECKSYQNWKRYIFFGDTHVLALILVLLSISVILWPTIDRFVNDKPEIHFSFLYYEYSPFKIKVACSNSGYADAFLKEGKIKLGKRAIASVNWEGQSPFLRDKSSKLFDFTLKYLAGNVIMDYPSDSLIQDLKERNKRVSINLMVINSGSDREKTHRIRLPHL